MPRPRRRREPAASGRPGASCRVARLTDPRRTARSFPLEISINEHAPGSDPGPKRPDHLIQQRRSAPVQPRRGPHASRRHGCHGVTCQAVGHHRAPPVPGAAPGRGGSARLTGIGHPLEGLDQRQGHCRRTGNPGHGGGRVNHSPRVRCALSTCPRLSWLRDARARPDMPLSVVDCAVPCRVPGVRDLFLSGG